MSLPSKCDLLSGDIIVKTMRVNIGWVMREDFIVRTIIDSLMSLKEHEQYDLEKDNVTGFVLYGYYVPIQVVYNLSKKKISDKETVEFLVKLPT
jgi:hypothetical protein